MNAKKLFHESPDHRDGPVTLSCRSDCLLSQPLHRRPKGFPAEGRVPASSIVEAVETFEDCDLGVSTRFPELLPQQLSFDRLEEGFDHCPAGSCIAFFPEPGGVIIAVAGSG